MGIRASQPSHSGAPSLASHGSHELALGVVAAPDWLRVRGYIGNVPPDIQGSVKLLLPPESCPLAFGAAEFRCLGDVRDFDGSLGGVVALVDPPNGERTAGAYELVFVSVDDRGEVDVEPTVRLVLGPRSVCSRCSSTTVEFLAHGLSQGPSAYSIRFLTADDADAFLRDLTVRLRVMTLALKHARGRTESKDLQAMLRSTQQQTLEGVLRWLSWWFFASLLGLAFCRALFLIVAGDSGQTILDAAVAALEDAVSAALFVLHAIGQVGSAALCSSAAGASNGASVVSQVAQCTSVLDSEDFRVCVEAALRARGGSSSKYEFGSAQTFQFESTDVIEDTTWASNGAYHRNIDTLVQDYQSEPQPFA